MERECLYIISGHTVEYWAMRFRLTVKLLKERPDLKDMLQPKIEQMDKDLQIMWERWLNKGDHPLRKLIQ